MAETAFEPTFGVQLRRSRQAAALSLRQLATRVGYDHSYLSQVERGRRPGSAHLAVLCDRELGTSPALSTAYQQTRPPAAPDGATVAGPRPEVPAAGVESLEAVRHELAGSFGPGREVAEWRAVATSHAHEFAKTPPAERLPELTADLQLLRTGAAAGSATLAVPAAELAVLIALTLAELGRLRAAERWWRTARATADGSAERRIASLARSWEATSGLAEHRPLPRLLELADDALVLAERPADVACALAARARVLAAQGEAAQARQVVRELQAVTVNLSGRSAVSDSPFEWADFETHAVEGRVCAALGDTLGAYLALDQALASCRSETAERAELELVFAHCLVMDRDVAAGLAVAMRVLVELPDQWHTHHLYDAAGHVLAAVRGDEQGRAAVWDYQALLRRRPFDNRTVSSGSGSGREQG
ncbi:helix-turn-helix transcriptional regulator [Kribbella sp. NPDC056861]|uniref:helix-turn-helix domain-containing protein n=1 Tax=Kribbella sp. NPDC056861 TaxID=3154857 RepID=UPI0034446B5D